MNPEAPFDSVESAHRFVTFLAQVVLDTQHDIEGDIQREMSSNFPRRLRALQIIENKLRTLEVHLRNIRRLLNDLCSLRRLLFGERTNGGVVVPRTLIGIANAEITPSRSPLTEASRLSVPPNSAVARPASIPVTVRKRALSSYRDAHAHNLKGADAVPWYIRPDYKPIGERKSREANEGLMQRR